MVLEDNNFITTLLEINDIKIKLDKNEQNSEKPGNSTIIKELETKFLEEIKVDNNKDYKLKFLSD